MMYYKILDIIGAIRILFWDDLKKPVRILFIRVLHCRSSVGDVHREHELEMQHLKTIHEQEMKALKAAFSHTR